ncbi:hypothetical protein C8R42DRAFT_726395 [Lentinula raphanica]|nr:hypothetical protein C8R42DRAFT_726395 [Lentinula raphanica]
MSTNYRLSQLPGVECEDVIATRMEARQKIVDKKALALLVMGCPPREPKPQPPLTTLCAQRCHFLCSENICLPSPLARVLLLLFPPGSLTGLATVQDLFPNNLTALSVSGRWCIRWSPSSKPSLDILITFCSAIQKIYSPNLDLGAFAALCYGAIETPFAQPRALLRCSERSTASSDPTGSSVSSTVSASAAASIPSSASSLSSASTTATGTGTLKQTTTGTDLQLILNPRPHPNPHLNPKRKHILKFITPNPIPPLPSSPTQFNSHAVRALPDSSNANNANNGSHPPMTPTSGSPGLSDTAHSPTHL